MSTVGAIILVVLAVVALLMQAISHTVIDLLHSPKFKDYVSDVREAVVDQSKTDGVLCGYPDEMEVIELYKAGYQPEVAAGIWRKERLRAQSS